MQPRDKFANNILELPSGQQILVQYSYSRVLVLFGSNVETTVTLGWTPTEQQAQGVYALESVFFTAYSELFAEVVLLDAATNNTVGLGRSPYTLQIQVFDSAPPTVTLLRLLHGHEHLAGEDCHGFPFNMRSYGE